MQSTRRRVSAVCFKLKAKVQTAAVQTNTKTNYNTIAKLWRVDWYFSLSRLAVAYFAAATGQKMTNVFAVFAHG